MRVITVAATQMSCSWDIDRNIEKAEQLIRQAVKKGANIVLLQELFETPYFCQKELPEYFAYATEIKQNKAILHFQKISKELNVVLPISFFERKNTGKYNSVAVIDTDGQIVGIYRKSHIPDGPGYEEKYYFNPGDTGIKVFKTKIATIGVGICWDQWFPEVARILALQGAELLFYPTAIGSEPQDNSLDSKNHWQRVMQGHAGANLVPVIASNRIGKEVVEDSSITFYGSSFITDCTGEKVQEAPRNEEGILIHTFDLDAIQIKRDTWGVFRDRRPDLYKVLLTTDGQ